MDNKKERKEKEPEVVTEVEDSDLDQVSGGFLRKIESKIPSAGTDESGKENGDYNS